MPLQFRKLRIGFVDLILNFLEGQDIAARHSRNAREYLKKNLNVQVLECPEPVGKRSQAIQAWK